jgi:hypothetical protein
MHLCEKITSAIDKKEFTIGIFLDLSKVFDTVDHEILFDKLRHYGIRGVALTWMKSYLSNRLQFVQYNNSCSSYKTIQCGVPLSLVHSCFSYTSTTLAMFLIF